MKKIVSLVMILCMVFALASCDDNTNDVTEVKPKVVLLTGVAGLGDQSFNDAIWSSIEKAQETSEFDTSVIEPENKDEIEDIIKEAVSEDPVLIVCAGLEYERTLKKISKDYLDSKFLLVDGSLDGLPNVVSASFSEDQSGFLAGVAAAMNSKSGVIGYVGGAEIRPVKTYLNGYRQGAQFINKDIEIKVSYIGNFTDESKGYAIAKEMANAGADVLFHGAGLGGIGVINLAKDKNIWAIGADMDQSKLASKNVLCSAVKEFDNILKDSIEGALEDELSFEHIYGEIKNQGVGISDNAGNLNKETKDKISELIKNDDVAILGVEE
ncbi:MAG: BMP family ABC transporter substrate-binding protein [Anaerovoracaceae bacterium]